MSLRLNCKCPVCVEHRMENYLYTSIVDERELENVLYALIRSDNSRLLDIAYHDGSHPAWVFTCQTGMMNTQLDPRNEQGQTKRLKKILKYVKK